VSLAQVRQVSLEPQTGVGLLHSVSSRHCWHVWFAVSHTPWLQSELCMQATQRPVATSQALFEPEAQSTFVAQPRHVWFVPSQMGVLPLQLAFEPHATHCPAADPLVSHTGLLPVQSAGLHARHACEVVSQMGVSPVHCALVMHPTHAPVAVSQIGVVALVQLVFDEQIVEGPDTSQSMRVLSNSPCT